MRSYVLRYIKIHVAMSNILDKIPIILVIKLGNPSLRIEVSWT